MRGLGPEARAGKVCSKCRTAKPFEDFPLRSDTKAPRRRKICRKCYRAQIRKTPRYGTQQQPKDYWRNRDYLKSYGITLLEYEALVKQQRGLCAICQQPPTGRRLAVDHNHTTRKIRALLCLKCNRGLGMFNDDPELLLKANAYLEAA